MKKSNILLILSALIIALVFVLTGCGKDGKKAADATDVPAVTDVPTELPTDEPDPTEVPTATPEPTATPKPTPEPIQVDAVMTDFSVCDYDQYYVEDADMDNDPDYPYMLFETNNEDFEGKDLYCFACLRLITGNFDDGYTRNFANPNEYKFYALKYKMPEGTVNSAQNYRMTTDSTGIPETPCIMDYDKNPLIADGKWHTLIIEYAVDMPMIITQYDAVASLNGKDPVDCFVLPLGNAVGDEMYVAWYGNFRSLEDINAWDENFSARFSRFFN